MPSLTIVGVVVVVPVDGGGGVIVVLAVVVGFAASTEVMTFILPPSASCLWMRQMSWWEARNANEVQPN